MLGNSQQCYQRKLLLAMLGMELCLPCACHSAAPGPILIVTDPLRSSQVQRPHFTLAHFWDQPGHTLRLLLAALCQLKPPHFPTDDVR